jgi:cytochrome c oxidase subunit IV
MAEHLRHDAETHASPKLYVLVFLALMVLTAATVFAATVDIDKALYGSSGPLNTVVALTIAFTKALLVIAFFMHVRWAGKLVVLVVGSGFVWLCFLLLFTFADYLSRAWSLGIGS